MYRWYKNDDRFNRVDLLAEIFVVRWFFLFSLFGFICMDSDILYALFGNAELNQNFDFRLKNYLNEMNEI